jgi:SAM-dependent methyltransferase
MNAREVIGVYDHEYAAAYDATFLLGKNFRECTAYEMSLVADLLQSARTWLDVACGTGYFLSHFPNVERCGLDLSQAMLEQARRSNPGVPLIEGDYLNDVPEWHDRWDLVSCMWYAYCYAGTVADVETVVRNLAAWTAPHGTCFLPICDPNVICKTGIPYRPPADSPEGRLEIPAVVWNWIDEPSGKRHSGLIAPHVDHLLALFESLFHDVEIHAYPTFREDCLQSRSAIIARVKRLVAAQRVP